MGLGPNSNRSTKKNDGKKRTEALKAKFRDPSVSAKMSKKYNS